MTICWIILPRATDGDEIECAELQHNLYVDDIGDNYAQIVNRLDAITHDMDMCLKSYNVTRDKLSEIDPNNMYRMALFSWAFEIFDDCVYMLNRAYGFSHASELDEYADEIQTYIRNITRYIDQTSKCLIPL